VTGSQPLKSETSQARPTRFRASNPAPPLVCFKSSGPPFPLTNFLSSLKVEPSCSIHKRFASSHFTFRVASCGWLLPLYCMVCVGCLCVSYRQRDSPTTPMLYRTTYTFHSTYFLGPAYFVDHPRCFSPGLSLCAPPPSEYH